MSTPRTITREEVEAMIDAGDAIVLEALPPAHWEQGHLPGALNLPHDRVDELAPVIVPDKSTPIIVYCANGPCPNSGVAARRLEQLGYTNVVDYQLGKQDWVEAGLALESGAPETVPER